jgi:trehalose 6-phosphate phosphatase
MHTNAARHLPSRALRPPARGDLGSIALLLDVDGTIVDTATTPGGVVVPAPLRSSLEELHVKCGGALALVSGRLIRDLDRLFAPLRLPAIGGHGAEMRLPDKPVAFAQGAELGSSFRDQVAAVAAADPRIILEDKGSSLAVHYRLAPQMQQTLKTKIEAIMARLAVRDVELMHGKAVIEIKSTRFSKGAAVRELMKRPPFLDRRPVFIGDDTTDESVFALLPTLGGLGYSVGRFIPGTNGTFGTPRDVRHWLASLCGSG